MLHYRLWFRLDARDGYLLWYSADVDGVLLDEHGRLLVFHSRTDLNRHAVAADIELKDEEPVLHDLDFVEYWLVNRRAGDVQCETLLGAWNLFGDVARSTGDATVFGERSRRARTTYHKLLAGCHMPALREAPIRPEWTTRDLETLATILRSGLHLFRAKLAEGDK